MQHKKIDHSKMSQQDKVRLTENIVIESPQFKRITDKMRECHERSKYTSEPRCLLVTGDTGYGKTTLAKHYAKDFPKATNGEGTVIRVLRSSIPSSASIKSMASWLLQDMGDPLPERGTTSSITMRLCRLIKACKVELIILDEFQHLIDRETEQVLITSADWLKSILNETGVPIVLMGMPWSVSILEAVGNDQLRRRFAPRMELKPFGWSNAAEQKEFIKFLMVLEKALPLKKESNLYSGDMPLRLFCATQGVMANLKRLISRAVENALERESEKINIDLLALAYDVELGLGIPGSVNPFRTDPEDLDPFKRPLPPDSGISAGRRGRRRKTGGAKQNISGILRK